MIAPRGRGRDRITQEGPRERRSRGPPRIQRLSRWSGNRRACEAISRTEVSSPSRHALRVRTPPLPAAQRIPRRRLQRPDRRAALDRVFVGAAALAEQGAAPTVAGLPSVIGEAMAPFGWAWNGFYAPLPGDEKPSALHVSAAFGPPVCSPLERGGGALSSGMCFDGFLLNQTLCAFDAGAWPGYVSCDAASGLGTVAGIVVPVRDANGAPWPSGTSTPRRGSSPATCARWTFCSPPSRGPSRSIARTSSAEQARAVSAPR